MNQLFQYWSMLRTFAKVFTALICLGNVRLAQAEAPPQIVKLTVAPYTGKNNVGLLMRELVRQSVLMTAREEFGLTTRDVVLGENSPPDAKVFSLEIDVSTGEGEGPLVTINRRETPKKVVLLKAFRLERLERDLIVGYVTRLETMSRTDFVTIFEQNGFTRKASQKGPATEEISTNRGRLDCLTQYATVRGLHDSIRKSGESVDRLAILARTYATLGTLTEIHWSPAHKVFKARALLYAQRLTNSFPNPRALQTRAFVLTMLGLFQAASTDLETVRQKLPADRPEEAATGSDVNSPEEVEVLDAFCQSDEARILKAASDGRHQHLARLLRLTEAELTPIYELRRRAAESLLELDPPNVRAADSVMKGGPLGIQKHVSNVAPGFFAEKLYTQILRITDLPDAIRNLATERTSSWDAEFRLRVKLMQALRDYGATGNDIGEPSLSVAAELIRDVNFVQAYRQLNVQRGMLAINADPLLESLRPLIQGHRYQGFIESHVSDQQSSSEALVELSKSIDLPHLESTEEPLIAALAATDAEMGSQLRLISRFHNDPVFRDIVDWSRRGATEEFQQYSAQTLRELAPNSLATIYAAIAFDWQYAESRAAGWEKKYADSAQIQDILAQRYMRLNKFDDAERCLKRRIELIPDHPTYEMLANLALSKGDEDGWVKTLEEALKLPAQGLELAHICVSLTRHFMKKKDLVKAREFADQAADSYAGWALVCAAECREQMGDFAGAELYTRRNAERYEGSQTDWYFWCRRTGHGKVKEALNLAVNSLKQMEEGEDVNGRMLAAFHHYAEGRLDRALEILREVFTLSRIAAVGLEAALLADEMGKADIRDSLLEESEKSAWQQSSQSALLIHDFRNALRSESPIPIDLKLQEWRMHALSAGVPTTHSCYLGRFLRSRGKIEEGNRLLRRAATAPYYNYPAAIVAGIVLVRNKLDGGSMRATEWDGEGDLEQVIEQTQAAFTQAQNKRFKEAHQILDQLLKTHPNSPDALFTFGIVSQLQTNHADAIKDFTAFLEQFPNSTEGLFFRGDCYERRKDYPSAIADYERIMKVNPYAPGAYFQLASLLSTVEDADVRDGKKAVQLARKGMQNEGAFPLWRQHFVLAGALAEAGEYPEAVKHMEEALKRAPKEVQTGLASVLESFRQETPFRRKR